MQLRLDNEFRKEWEYYLPRKLRFEELRNTVSDSDKIKDGCNKK